MGDTERVATVPTTDFASTLQRIVRSSYAQAMCGQMNCKSLLKIYSLDLNDAEVMD